jgi:DNA processing protein
MKTSKPISGVIYRDDEEYPKLLKKIGKQAPKQLYFKVKSSYKRRFDARETNFFESFSPIRASREQLAHTYDSKKLSFSHNLEHNLDLSIFDNCLAVVGTRKLTSYGRQIIEQLVGKIALSGVTIVSGFMYGGDAAAHQAALKAGGRTIAVMPCGINRIHPEDQVKLYQEILDNNGLIISEHQGNMAPVLWTYPQRNRIIAGLSKALLIIEAGDKSGCLITANYARKFKRKIFVVPGQITSSVSKGSNALIKQGAEMVLEADDILKHYRSGLVGLTLRETNFFESLSPIPPAAGQYVHAYDSKKLSLSRKMQDKDPGGIEKQILDLLSRESLGADELSRQLGMPIPELSVKLSAMEMRGIIKLRGNKYVAN